MASIGKPGTAGNVNSVEYEATYVAGAFTVNGPLMIPPVAFVQPENLWIMNPSGIVSFSRGLIRVPTGYQSW